MERDYQPLSMAPFLSTEAGHMPVPCFCKQPGCSPADNNGSNYHSGSGQAKPCGGFLPYFVYIFEKAKVYIKKNKPPQGFFKNDPKEIIFNLVTNNSIL